MTFQDLLLDKFKLILEENNVQFGIEDMELAKLKPLQYIIFDENSPILGEILNFFEILKAIVESDDELSVSLLFVDKLRAICKREKKFNKEKDLYEVKMKNIFAIEAMEMESLQPNTEMRIKESTSETDNKDIIKKEDSL